MAVSEAQRKSNSIGYIKTFLHNIIKSIGAALLISIVSYCNLICTNKFVGAFLFSFGLIIICKFGFNLFTGMAGYVKLKNISSFFVAIITNLVFTFAFGLIMSYNTQATTKAIEICNAKMSIGLLNLFISSVFCGIMIFIGVEYYKQYFSFIGILFAIPIFVICGFDHAVADTFYYAVAGQYDVRDLIPMLIIVVGNIIGSTVMRFILFTLIKNINNRQY